MQGSAFYPVSADLEVRVIREMPLLSPKLSEDVDTVWRSEQQRLSNRLFNGRVFSADVITPRLVTGHWTEFRRIVAQMRRPELHEELGVRPLAVGGIITSPDGIVFGRRPERSVYQAGEWQLPPAGSVDQSCVKPDGEIDFLAMLFIELAEELGITSQQVFDAHPVGLVEHAESHVLDLGIALSTQLSSGEIFALHAALGNGEYDQLVVIEPRDLPAFIAQPNVTLQAPLFLHACTEMNANGNSGTSR